MQVSEIKIQNILGTKQLEFKAGRFNEITGKNGTGKTSVMAAIQSALSGGHDATLLRKGEKEGEIVLVLEDGSSIRKRVWAEKSDIEMRDANGLKMPTPATKIKSLIDALSVNPVDFLNAKADKRVSVLLESMPIKADNARLEAITGQKVSASDVHALEVISALRKKIYDERTGTNGAIKSKQATITQLSNAIPESDCALNNLSEESLLNEIKEIDGITSANCGKIQAKISRIRETANAEIEDLQKQIADIQFKIAEKKAYIQEQNFKASQFEQKEKSEAEAKKQAINNDLRIIRQNRDNIAKAAQVKETIKTMANESIELEEVAKKQNSILDELDAYKLELLSALPVAGLEVKDGDIYFNGVNFDRVNTAEKVKIAVEIAKLRAGKIGLICVDGIENLDPETYDTFRNECLKTELQFVVTRATGTDFNVESIG